MQKILAAVVLTLVTALGHPAAAATLPAGRIPAWLGIARHPLLEAIYLVAEHHPADALPYLERSFRQGNAVAPYWMARLLAAGAQGKSGEALVLVQPEQE